MGAHRHPPQPSPHGQEEQHRSHEEWMERVAQELFEHQRNLPEKRGRARDLDEYRLKKEYLLYEVGQIDSSLISLYGTPGNAGGIPMVVAHLHPYLPDGRGATMGLGGH